MYQMTAEEKIERERVKALHKAIREGGSPRYRNLAWGFVRGFKYRRIERNHHMQEVPTSWGTYGYVEIGDKVFFEHNLPYPKALFNLLKKHLPELQEKEVVAWLEDRTGAIPAPPPRPKRPFMRPQEAAPAAE